jgi:hypothetical protein
MTMTTHRCSHTPAKYFTSLEDMMQYKDEIPYYFNKNKIFRHAKDSNVMECNESYSCEIIFRTITRFSIVVSKNKNPTKRVIVEV